MTTAKEVTHKRSVTDVVSDRQVFHFAINFPRRLNEPRCDYIEMIPIKWNFLILSESQRFDDTMSNENDLQNEPYSSTPLLSAKLRWNDSLGIH